MEQKWLNSVHPFRDGTVRISGQSSAFWQERLTHRSLQFITMPFATAHPSFLLFAHADTYSGKAETCKTEQNGEHCFDE